MNRKLPPILIVAATVIALGVVAFIVSSKRPDAPVNRAVEPQSQVVTQEGQDETISVQEADLSGVYKVDELKKVLAERVGSQAGGLVFSFVETKGEALYAKASSQKPGSGFHFVAAHDTDGWSIKFAGQDSVPCPMVEQYGFTEDGVPECWDEKTKRNVVRANERMFTPLPNDKNSQDIALVNQYYEHIAKGNLQEAYDLHAKPFVVFTEFEGWYKEIRSVALKDLISSSGNTYQVIITIRDKDKEPLSYRVKLGVNDGFLDTISSEEIIGENYFKDNVFVAGLRKDNHFYLLMEKDGKERIVQESRYDKDSEKPQAEYFVPRYSNPRFQYDDNLLFYTTGGWEYMALNVFDLRNNKVIFTREFPSIHGFNKDKTLYYDCNDYGLASGREIKIWSVPDFKEVAATDTDWIALKYSNYKCRYDSWTNALTVTLDTPGQDNKNLPQQRELYYPLNRVSEIQKNLKGIAEDECLASPRMLEIGWEVYPINEKYKAVHFIGQLFTASDCGPERMTKIWGVSKDRYGIGSHLYFKQKLSTQLLATLEEIGFTPDDSCKAVSDKAECVEWFLYDDVPVSDILKLKPYAPLMSGEDCINCG